MRSFIKNWVDKKGRKQGYWEIYWDNGQLHSKGLYENDIQNGVWEYYYDNGSLYSKKLFENGYFIDFV